MSRILIASDLHGDAECVKTLLEQYRSSGAERLLLLGDILYHGPRNDLPKGYAPKEVISLLNGVKEELLCVRGNCDTEVDQMVLDFPILADYAYVTVDGHTFFATHGHNFNMSKLPPLKKGDILMAMTDMKDNVQILGNTAIMEVDDQYIVNQRVGVLRCKKERGISYPYVFLLTNGKDFLLDLRSRANSGVQVNLSSTEIKNSPIYIAPRYVYDEFTSIVLPMFETMISNDIQNQQLAELRDTLLPKLISGEIDVSDIQL